MLVSLLLLPLAGTPPPEPVLETALRVARRFNAHLDVLYVRPSPRRLLPYATLVSQGVIRGITLQMAESRESAELVFRRLQVGTSSHVYFHHTSQNVRTVVHRGEPSND